MPSTAHLGWTEAARLALLDARARGLPFASGHEVFFRRRWRLTWPVFRASGLRLCEVRGLRPAQVAWQQPPSLHIVPPVGSMPPAPRP